MEPNFSIRPFLNEDRPFVRRFVLEHWGGEEIVVHGDIFHPADLEGFLAIMDDQVIGLVTYHFQGTICEIISLDSLLEDRGIGSALILNVESAALEAYCHQLCLTTTNDNLRALGFYQKRGFRLAAISPDAVTEARKIKPGIPFIGESGIPITDEILLVKEMSRN